MKHGKKIRLYKKEGETWRPWKVAVPIIDVTMVMEFKTGELALAYLARLLS